jgi:HEAT repeat protein
MSRTLAVALAATLVSLATGCGNPSDPEGWARRAVSRARTDEKLEALAHVRKLVGHPADGKEASTAEQRRAAVDPLVALVANKQVPARVRAEAVLALADVGDTRAVKPLLDAIDPAPRDRDGWDLNRKIADALGILRATEAVAALEALAKAGDGYTQVAAVDALGKVGDPAAVDTLAEIATSEKSEPFTAKKALLAIGQIGDDDQHRGRAAAFRMAFAGTDFFPAASFAAYQIGKPMAEPLLAVLQGKESEVTGWARGRGASEGALVATSAQLLGDVGGPEAIGPLVGRLSYGDPNPGVQTLVRVFTAESLGRLRAKEAVRPILDLASRETDGAVRDRYCGAVARIGDPAALAPLKAMAQAAPSAALRAAPLLAVSRLGGKEDRAAVEAGFTKDCPAQGCPADLKALYEGMLARLDAAAACGADVACWEKKLEDPGAAVRDRAALEVGGAGGARAVPALAGALARPVNDDADVAARYHALLAIHWIAGRGPVGPAGPEAAARIDAMLAADRGRTLTAVVNEDALRLATRLRRAR